VAALQAKLKSRVEAVTSAVGSGGFDITALLAWAAVGIPLAWGIWITLQKLIGHPMSDIPAELKYFLGVKAPRLSAPPLFRVATAIASVDPM
jgi:hypothetical protein